MIQQLGFDQRFKYPNVQINGQYHIVQVDKPQRHIMDFMPNNLVGGGTWGQNYMFKFDHSDHSIIDSFANQKVGCQSVRFSNIEKQDRPFNKNCHLMN